LTLQRNQEQYLNSAFTKRMLMNHAAQCPQTGKAMNLTKLALVAVMMAGLLFPEAQLQGRFS
jgi:hypothetical protein